MFNKKRLIIILFLFMALSDSLKAQQSDIRFDRLSREQGLSQTARKCIAQDRQGFLWFGTEDGLNRYDGYGFTVYKYRIGSATSLSNSQVNSIYQDNSGALWVGTTDGLNRFDPKSQSFTTYRKDPQNPT